MTIKLQIVAVVAEKGGVGKTTLALTLAVAAVQSGRKVAVFDLDPQATAAQWTDRRAHEFPWVVATPATRLDAAIANAKGQCVDFIVIDTPPHAGTDAVEAARRSDLVIVPVEPHLYTLETLPKLGDLLKLGGDAPALFVVNKAAVQGKEGQDAAAYIKAQGFNVCPVTLHLRAAHRHAGNVGQTAQEYEPKSKAADESQQLYMYTLKLLTKRGDSHGQAKPAHARA
ncbi:MAG: ParA family protein [Candidatus Dechloromonas phosphoritropha]|jgi:chromosome partitioning protein|nr:ParA family protein [Candidatus Dechloromonas phosphoritropha]